MKKLILLFLCIFILTGCKKDNMEDITVYTTIYPIEYITNILYGEHSDIYSVYPNEVIDLSDTLLKNYSASELFVYDGLSNEKSYAVKMLNNNKDLKIVDATMGMSIEYDDEELWLNPSNFLMLALNIKNGMKEYITNTILRNEIETKYNELKVNISELDAEINLLVNNANAKEILVGNDLFNFMTKYNLKIYSLSNESASEKTKEIVKNEVKNGNIKYIILLDTDTLSEDVEAFLTENGIEKLYYNSLTTLSKDDKSSGKDYLSVMRENLDILKQELYN